MALVTSLDTLMCSIGTFILDSLHAAPFQTFAIFLLLQFLLAPTVITLVCRWCGLAPGTDNESQRTCPTRDGSGVVDVTQDKSSQTEAHWILRFKSSILESSKIQRKFPQLKQNRHSQFSRFIHKDKTDPLYQYIPNSKYAFCFSRFLVMLKGCHSCLYPLLWETEYIIPCLSCFKRKARHALLYLCALSFLHTSSYEIE